MGKVRVRVRVRSRGRGSSRGEGKGRYARFRYVVFYADGTSRSIASRCVAAV